MLKKQIAKVIFTYYLTKSLSFRKFTLFYWGWDFTYDYIYRMQPLYILKYMILYMMNSSVYPVYYVSIASVYRRYTSTRNLMAIAEQ